MTDDEPPPTRRLLAATAVAVALALVVLVVAVLPAEYGVDPTGIGSAFGFTRLADDATDGGTTPEPDETPGNTTVTVRTFTSRFPVTAARVLGAEGYTAEGATTTLRFPVTAVNVTRVTARLDFVDANETNGQKTRPDTFEVQLKAPFGDVSDAGLGRSHATTGGGTASTTFNHREPPFPRDFQATTASAARAALHANDPADASLVGEWTARITMVEAGDADVPLPTAGTPFADNGNTWTLTVTVFTYDLAVQEKPGSAKRQDSVTLTLPPGADLEYKLRVSLGNEVAYDWATEGGPLYYDFHGEKAGDASGGFTRHQAGTASGDDGTLIAPFDGTHGWYWRNPGTAAVTVTLKTQGQYDVVGRV